MNRPVESVDLQIGGTTRPFYYRSDSDGDRGVVQQVFGDRVYDLSGFTQIKAVWSLYQALRASKKTALIVDAGANIGASAVYLSGVFAGSKIVAIEPERNNCALLRRNCDGLDFSLCEGGIGCEAGSLYLTDPGQGDWGFRLETQGEYLVPVFDATSMVERHIAQGLVPLLFKIDIEGGESDLFKKNTSWVSRFPALILELHDWLFPGAAKSRNFLRVLSSLNFDFVVRGENVFCFNNDLLGPATA